MYLTSGWRNTVQICEDQVSHLSLPKICLIFQTNNTTYYPEKFVNQEIWQLPVIYLKKKQVFIGANFLNTQQTFTCSKSTIETLEKDVKYV